MEIEERNQKIKSHNEKVLARLVSLEVPKNRYGEVHGRSRSCGCLRDEEARKRISSNKEKLLT